MNPSYLGSMPTDERAAAIVLGLTANTPLVELFRGGHQQFVTVCRPYLRNWGCAIADLDKAWEFIREAYFDPGKFNRRVQMMQARTRKRIH